MNTFFITSRSVFLRMRNVSDVVEKIKTHASYSITFFENHAVYMINWKNNVQPGRPQITVRLMWISCLIPKATNTYSGYVILLIFPLQQWLHESASTLRCKHIVCLASNIKINEFVDFLMLISPCFVNQFLKMFQQDDTFFLYSILFRLAHGDGRSQTVCL
jgi:hypothetical protein